MLHYNICNPPDCLNLELLIFSVFFFSMCISVFKCHVIIVHFCGVQRDISGLGIMRSPYVVCHQYLSEGSVTVQISNSRLVFG